MQQKLVIRSIGVGSAFKVGFVIGLALSLIVIIPAALAFFLSNPRVLEFGPRAMRFPRGGVVEIVLLLCMPFGYGIAYGVVTALSAIVYNVVAAIVGGLEVSVETAKE